jgi:hypothetical protein
MRFFSHFLLEKRMEYAVTVFDLEKKAFNAEARSKRSKPEKSRHAAQFKRCFSLLVLRVLRVSVLNALKRLTALSMRFSSHFCLEKRMECAVKHLGDFY